MKKNIFITGLSGCVGHYLFNALSDNEDYHLYLFVRTLRNIKLDISNRPNITLINGTIHHIAKYADLLKQMDYVVHILTSWGGPWAQDTNIDKTLDFFNLLDHSRLKKIVYFSTASILGADSRPDPNALKYGTDYVKTKYRAYQEIKQLPYADKVYTVFPTLVLGGSSHHPYSHITSGLAKLDKMLWLLRFFSLDMKFNYIHSHDIALLVKYIIENQLASNDLVLGNPAVSFDEVINSFCHKRGIIPGKKMDLTDLVQKYIPKIIKMHEWTRYCLHRRHFVYDSVNTATFGINSEYQKLEKCLEY